MSVSPGRVRCACARRRQASTTLTFITAPDTTGSRFPFSPASRAPGPEALAHDVRGLKVGDRVAYAGPIGGYSEVRLIEADRLVKLPDAISFHQAAAMMPHGLNAKGLNREG